MKERIIVFLKKETILCIAALLALGSAFLIPPDEAYWDYCDMRVMALLFCLMAVMGGFQGLGLFDRWGSALLKKVKNLRQLTTTLVMLCFFSAMVVTNDVALITFVPFTILVLRRAGLEEELIPILVLQTIAANLGSMLTPVGNPQNLYLYTVSGMNLREFFACTLHLTLFSLLLLWLFCMNQKTKPLGGVSAKTEGSYTRKEKKELVALGLLFLLCLLAVFRLLPYLWVLGAVLLWFLLFGRETLRRLDYFLLLTFLCFFILIGNLGRMALIRETLQTVLEGREVLAAFFSSQIISNVPAAVLLSGFTERYDLLLAGVNIGGLGTLIASMASLISYKYFAQAAGEQRGRYLLYFTKMNVLFAAVLLAVNGMLK